MKTSNPMTWAREAARRSLGSAGYQPAGLGSLPRPGNDVSLDLALQTCRRQAAGDYGLAACAPQKLNARS